MGCYGSKKEAILSFILLGGPIEIGPHAVCPIILPAAICEINFSEPDGLAERGNNLLLAQPLGKMQVTEGFRQEKEPETKDGVIAWSHRAV